HTSSTSCSRHAAPSCANDSAGAVRIPPAPCTSGSITTAANSDACSRIIATAVSKQAGAEKWGARSTGKRSASNMSAPKPFAQRVVELRHAMAHRVDPERRDGVEVAAAVDVDQLVAFGPLDDDRRVVGVARHLREAVPDDCGVAPDPLLGLAHCLLRDVLGAE